MVSLNGKEDFARSRHQCGKEHQKRRDTTALSSKKGRDGTPQTRNACGHDGKTALWV